MVANLYRTQPAQALYLGTEKPHLRVTLAEATDRRGSTVNAIMYIAQVLDNALHLHIRDRALQEALPR